MNMVETFLSMVETFLSKERKNHGREDEAGNTKQMSHGSCSEGRRLQAGIWPSSITDPSPSPSPSPAARPGSRTKGGAKHS